MTENEIIGLMKKTSNCNFTDDDISYVMQLVYEGLSVVDAVDRWGVLEAEHRMEEMNDCQDEMIPVTEITRKTKWVKNNEYYEDLP